MNFQECQVIDSEQVQLLAGKSAGKTRGGKMKVYLAMLLKTTVGKMSETGLSTMLLKANELKPPFHDLLEKKRG